MSAKPLILHIAVPSPLRRSFDYLAPENVSGKDLQPGQRLTIPFGSRHVTGILLGISHKSDFAPEKLKAAEALLDSTPILSPDLLKLGQWASRYYQHPVGDVFSQTLPVLLRQGKSALPRQASCWQLTEQGQIITSESLKRAPKQAQALETLKSFPEGLSEHSIKLVNLNVSTLKALEQKGFVQKKPMSAYIPTEPSKSEDTKKAEHYNKGFLKETHLTLNKEQSACYEAIAPYISNNPLADTNTEGADSNENTNKTSSHTFLIEGITGSGKTEIYLQLIEQCLRNGLQSLVLVPEIGLTPQTISRFEHRFNAVVVTMHSGLLDRNRLDNWLRARSGEAQIIIGTRSAVFIPMEKPGVIIVDEEHDTSYAQQDGFRYSARDIAIMRGSMENIPVVLGSATPSLETLHNALSGKYSHFRLNKRATNAVLPEFTTLDISKETLSGGLSQSSLKTIKEHLQANNQVLIFLNRRGFAPQLICHPCGWQARCRHCEASLTLHKAGNQNQGRLHCHHCASNLPVPAECPACKNKKLLTMGTGTEQLEEVLGKHFKRYPIIRIDRDNTRSKGAFSQKLDKIHSGKAMILVGTQMLAKGHHFPDVTLVVLVDIDASLFSTDFRASERIAQLVTQVAGRAGRVDKPGQVLIQTQQADHPFLNRLISKGYHEVALQELKQRELAGWPPFVYLAMLRAESPHMEQSLAFLEESADSARNLINGTDQTHADLALMGPVPAPMEKRAGRYRAQLLLQSRNRKYLQQILGQWILLLESSKSGKKVRWSLDVDPVEIY